MSARISPEERAALPVARAALESRASAYGIAESVVFALGGAGLLQSPESAAEVERLRGELTTARAALAAALDGRLDDAAALVLKYAGAVTR